MINANATELAKKYAGRAPRPRSATPADGPALLLFLARPKIVLCCCGWVGRAPSYKAALGIAWAHRRDGVEGCDHVTTPPEDARRAQGGGS